MKLKKYKVRLPIMLDHPKAGKVVIVEAPNVVVARSNANQAYRVPPDLSVEIKGEKR